MSVGGILHGWDFQSLSKAATAALRSIAAAARGVQVLGFDPVFEWSHSAPVLLSVGHTLLHDAGCGEVVKYCPAGSLNISDVTYIEWSVRKAALGNIARVVSK